MKPVVLVLWICAVLGCAHTSTDTAPAPLVFDYGAFDLTVQLTLRSDRTFTETEIGPLVALSPNGARWPSAVRDLGTYAVDGDRVVLYSRSGARRTLRRIDGLKTILREEVRGQAHDYVQEVPNSPSKTNT